MVSESSYQVTLEQINNALYWHTHPQYLETKAQVLEWGIRSNLQPDKTAGLDQAKSLYLQATELRPSWPTTWASLALVKWHLQEFDQQLLTYLNKAHQFGKNQPEVHLIWVQLASAIGKSNNPQLIEFIAPYQDKVNYHISQGLKDPRTKKQIEQVMTQ